MPLGCRLEAYHLLHAKVGRWRISHEGAEKGSRKRGWSRKRGGVHLFGTHPSFTQAIACFFIPGQSPAAQPAPLPLSNRNFTQQRVRSVLGTVCLQGRRQALLCMPARAHGEQLAPTFNPAGPIRVHPYHNPLICSQAAKILPGATRKPKSLSVLTF